jgi:toxin ParE1/3/4
VNVRFTRTALRQLDEVLDYIEIHNTHGARHVRDRIHAIIALLSLNPLTGQATDRTGQRRMVINPYPYVMFYRVNRDEIVDQRIRHTARQPL